MSEHNCLVFARYSPGRNWIGCFGNPLKALILLWHERKQFSKLVESQVKTINTFKTWSAIPDVTDKLCNRKLRSKIFTMKSLGENLKVLKIIRDVDKIILFGKNSGFKRESITKIGKLNFILHFSWYLGNIIKYLLLTKLEVYLTHRRVTAQR